MKKLYFVRHGLSELNKLNVMSGDSDTPLTEEGHAQAKLAGQKAKEQGLAFDLIISSPLQRAYHTAQHIADAVGYPHDGIEVNDLFKERYYGSLEGVAKAEINQGYFHDESAIDSDPGVEPFEDFLKRVRQCLDYLKSLNDETVLVVSHGAFGRALYRAVHNLSYTRRKILYDNADIQRFI